MSCDGLFDFKFTSLLDLDLCDHCEVKVCQILMFDVGSMKLKFAFEVEVCSLKLRFDLKV